MKYMCHFIGLSRRSEVFLLALIGIAYTILEAFDAMQWNNNLAKIWDLTFDSSKFSDKTQIYIKEILSGILFVRTFSVHIYLAFYIVMLWPILVGGRAGLLVPWLIICTIKCLLMSAASFVVGLYICICKGFYKPCLELVLFELIEYGPSFYLWSSILSYYHELNMKSAIVPYQRMYGSDLLSRRRKVRNLAESSSNSYIINRQFISGSIIENAIKQLSTDLHRQTTRSLDSLLGVMAAEVEKQELLNAYDDIRIEESGLTVYEKMIKLLNLTETDIADAKLKQFSKHRPLFTKSMLNLQMTGESSMHGTLKFKRSKSEELKIIRNEESVINDKQLKKPISTKFMVEMPEIQIGNVIDYSAISCLDNKSTESNSTEKENEEVLSQKPLIPLRASTPQQSEIATKNSPKQSEGNSIKNKMSKPRVKVSRCRKKNDSWCQASTLSRSILKVPLREIKRYFRNDLLDPPLNEKPNIPLKKKTLEHDPSSIPFLSKKGFKMDGYVVAYMRKMSGTN